MIFDKLCRFAERQTVLKGLQGILEQAHLFQFPYAPHDVLPKTYTREALDFHKEHFALPFPITAIEDNASCLVMWEAKPEDAIGFKAPRFWVECAPMDDNHAQAWNNAESEMEARAEMPDYVKRAMQDSVQISFGMVHNIDPEPKEGVDTSIPQGVQKWRYAVAAEVHSMSIFDGEEVVDAGSLYHVARDQIDPGLIRNAVTAIEELMSMNTPDRFILRNAPLNPRKRGKKAPKLLRSHERPIYTLRTPAEIREVMELPASTRAVHERRRHVRRYPDDPIQWPNMHGLSKVIPAAWVGPSDSTVKKRRYKVMLDL